MAVTDAERIQARIELLEEHLRCENCHDLDAVMQTFGAGARYDDTPWADLRTDRESVRAYYTDLMRALPDLAIEVLHRHVASESIVLEVTIRGTHLGVWRGLRATGRRIEFPLCAVYTFDDRDLLAGERIYYDRGVVLRQLGLFREPLQGLGLVLTVLCHPLTILRAYLRRSTPAAARERAG